MNRYRGAVIRIIISSVCLFAILGATESQAQTTKQDVLRLYWDSALTQVIKTTASVPDTVTTYLVLENPSVTGALAKCTFTFWDGTLDFIDSHSDLGAMTQIMGGEFEIVPVSPVPLTNQLVLGTFRFAVDHTGLDHLSVTQGMYWVEGNTQSIATQLPYSVWECVWLNPGPPNVSFLQTSLPFGERGTNRTTILTAQLQNAGAGPLFLTPNFSSGCEAFSILNPEYVDVIPPFGYLTLKIGFSPDTTTDFPCILSLESGLDLALSGTGRDPIYSLSSPDSVVFDPVVVGQTDLAALPVTNNGDYPVTLLAVFPDSCSGFSTFLGPEGYHLLPDKNASVVLKYQASSPGLQECTIELVTDMLSVHLIASGRQLITSYEITPSQLNFGSTLPGEPITGSVLIHNTGETTLDLEFHVEDPANVFTLLASTSAMTLLPGRMTNLPITFEPQIVGYYEARLVLGDSLPDVPLSGLSVEILYDLEISPTVLLFDPTNPGETDTKLIHITNTGFRPIAIDPWSTSPLFLGLELAGFLQPGQSMDLPVTFRPYDYGRFDLRLFVNKAHGFWLDCIGPPRLDFSADENRIGFFFDPDFTELDYSINSEPQAVTAYLVMTNPSDSSGISGWECKIQSSEGCELVGHQLVGDSFNVTTPDEFTVGVAPEPLPYSSNVLLGTFEYFVWDMSVQEIQLELMPTTRPSIPGMMSWTPTGDITDLTPMLTTTGLSTVAWIRLDTTVGTSTTTPVLVQQNSGIILSWPNKAPAGSGYHVYRRLDAGTPQKLTTDPLISTAATVTFQDTPVSLVFGTILHYSYRLVTDGREVAQSPEVEHVFQGVLPLVTRLLPNVPNPFNPQTEIRFELAESSLVLVNIYDVTGRRVRQLENATLKAGPYALTWSGRDDQGRRLPSGAYYVRLETDGKIDRRKIMLLK